MPILCLFAKHEERYNLMQGKDRSQIHRSDAAKRDDQAGAGRRAGAASAFSRHPDLAEAPVAIDSTDEVNANSPAPQRQNSATAAPAFVPLPVTPAVESMLQARRLIVIMIAAVIVIVKLMVAGIVVGIVIAIAIAIINIVIAMIAKVTVGTWLLTVIGHSPGAV